jgi:hypothetical protein
VTPCNTSGKSGLYRIFKFLISIPPFVGQSAGGRFSGIISGASEGNSKYSLHLSTL